ncbi:MAG: outer membrane protein assembly factor BamB family protein, partial [Planctomycetota bacterium]
RAYRAQPSPEAALTWGSFLGRTGELDAALNVLDAGRAGVGAGSDAARALEEAAYDLARREARRLDADGQNEAALTAWIRASRYAGDLPRAAGDLAALAQKLVDSARLQDAATVLGRLSGLGDASLTIESASEHVLARTWARLRLQELRATDGGPEALAAFDREAAEALAAIRGQLSPEPLQSLAERYPTSPAEADALLLTADLFERQGLPNVAAQYLRDRLNRFPERRDTKDLLLRRARLLERTLRYTEAVADYRLLRDHFGSARVMDDPRELSELADERLRALAPLVSDPSFQTPTGAGDELGLVFQTRTDLENTDPVVFSPAGLDPETARVFLVLGEQSLEGRLVETGLVKWRLKFTEPPRKEHVVAADPSTIVLYADSTLLALDLTSGEIRWRAALDEIAPPPAAELTPPPGEGEEPSEDELEPEEDVDDLARPDRFRGIAARAGHLVCTISDGAFALEAATGKLRWRKEGIEDLGPFTQITPLEGGRHTVVLAQEVPATLIGLDLASGAERYRTLLGEGEPRLSLGPTPTEGAWTFVVTSGPRLSACDVVTGRVLWAKRVPYWPRKIFGEPYGQAVAVLPFGGSPNQPKLSVFDGRTGATLYEERTERSAVTAARLTGDTLYLLAGDYMSTRVHAIDWRKGGRQWSFSPPPGHGFEEITISQSHLVLPKSGPAGAGMIYLVGRSRGSLYRTLELARRRAVSVALVGGTLVIGTNRGLLGYKRVDRGRLLEQQAEVTQELSRDPGNARLRAFLADRRFKAGDIDGAIITLRKALELEDMARSVYASMYEQLEGYLEAREPDLVVDVYRATEPPEIDGELWDAWPIEQSFRLSSVGPITTVQGLEGADAVLKGDDDLAGTLYVSYDDRYFYFALDVTDSTLIPYDSEDETWQGDCLLMAIDPKGNGGDYFMRDDILLSLALALPKKNKQDPGEEEEEEDDEPEGKFFVKRKDDRSGAVYEAAIPWASFADRQAEIDPVLGPKAGFQFGLNLILTDDDDGSGARKVLQLAPAVNLHRVKQRLWQGLVPGRFLKVRLQ